MDDDPYKMGYAAVEEAALVGWSPAAKARIARIKYDGDSNAMVIVDTEPSRPMRQYCERRGDGLWYYGGGGHAASDSD